jgi:O-antigen/teichoic acid export membrane protein
MYLIPRYSFIGASYSTLISEILLMTMGFIAVRRVIEVNLETGRIAKLLLISSLSVAAAYLIKLTAVYFVFNIAAIIILYLYLAYISDSIPRDIANEYLTKLFSRFKRSKKKA